MKFQAFHVNPGEKLKKKDVNNDLSHFMSVFPNEGICVSFFKKIQQTGKVLQSGRFLFFHKNEVCSEFLRLRHI